MSDTKIGTGAEATPGQYIQVHYTGWLFDAEAPDNKGAKFDSSRDKQNPFKFPLGGGRVIKGWDQGVEGMQAGEKRLDGLGGFGKAGGESLLGGGLRGTHQALLRSLAGPMPSVLGLAGGRLHRQAWGMTGMAGNPGPKRSGLVTRIIRILTMTMLALAISFGVALALYRFVPAPSTLMLGRWLTFREVNRDWVPLEQISPHLVRAVIAAFASLPARVLQK